MQVVLSDKSLNASIANSAVGSFAVTMYQYSTSTIVVRSCSLLLLYSWLIAPRLQGSYPTVIIVLVNSKHGVLRPDGESTFMNSSSLLFNHTPRRTERRSLAHPPETTVDLYELAGARKGGEPDSKSGPDSASTVRTLR